MSRTRWSDEIGQEARFALRTLRRHAGFTAAAVATLAFGIGATTAILSVVNGVLIRPLPYPHAAAPKTSRFWVCLAPATQSRASKPISRS